jgi:hypothetical protein
LNWEEILKAQNKRKKKRIKIKCIVSYESKQEIKGCRSQVRTRIRTQKDTCVPQVLQVTEVRTRKALHARSTERPVAPGQLTRLEELHQCGPNPVPAMVLKSNLGKDGNL